MRTASHFPRHSRTSVCRVTGARAGRYPSMTHLRSICALLVGVGLAACVEPDTGSAAYGLEADAGVRDVCVSGTGALAITNHTRHPLTIDIAESTGVISTLSIPPGRSDRWKVATGYTGVEAHVEGFRAPAFTNTYQVQCDEELPVDVLPPDFVRPAAVVMRSGRQVTSAGAFTCDPGRASTSLTTATVGSNLEYRLTCGDPAAPRTLRTLAIQVPRTSVVDGVPPEPARACVERFRSFRSRPELPYFRARFDATELDCQATGTEVDPTSFGFPYQGPPVPAPGPSGDLAIVTHHAADADGHSSYDTYEQAAMLFSGETGNTITFRYRNKDINPDSNITYWVQIAGQAQSTGTIADPCDDWAVPTGLIESATPPITVKGTAPLTVEFSRFYQHLAGPGVFYLRVVPLRPDASGDPVCSQGPSNWVELDVADYDPVADPTSTMNTYLTSPPVPPGPKYYASFLSYQPPVLSILRWNADRVYTPTKPNKNGWAPTAQCEYVVEVTSGSKPFYQAVWDGFIGAIEWANAEYTAAKNKVIAEAVGAIPGCSGICAGVVSAGMNDALGNLNIPTHIPNFDYLMSQSTSYSSRYVARLIAKETGAEPYLDNLTWMVNQLSMLATSQLSGGSAVNDDDMYTWGKPEPYWLPRPAVAWLMIVRDDFDGPDAGGSLLVSDSNHIWKPQQVTIPPMPPGGSMIIPVALSPAIKDIYSSSALQKYNDAANNGYWYNFEYAQGAGEMRLAVQTSGAPQLLVQPAGQPYGDYGALTMKPGCP